MIYIYFFRVLFLIEIFQSGKVFRVAQNLEPLTLTSTFSHENQISKDLTASDWKTFAG